MRYPIIVPQSRINLIAHKTIKHEIIECNEAYLKYSGVKSLDKIYGLTAFDLPWGKYADTYHQQEKDCLDGKIYSAIFPCCDFKGRSFVIFNSKSPKFNDNKNIIGLISLSIDISNRYFFELLQILNKKLSVAKGYTINNNSNQFQLTNRESECLFYLLRGKTAKLIAKILNISPRTVEMYIDNLKLKFCCLSKLQLIEMAINNGYMEIIPPNLLNENLLDSLK